MKKVLFVVLPALLAVCFSACQKENDLVENNDENKTNELVQVTFTASTIDTKTAIGGLSAGEYPVTWSASDQITVIAVDGDGVSLSNTTFDIDPADAGKSTAKFTGMANAGAQHYFAVYPAMDGVTTSGTGSTATITLPESFRSHDVLAVANGFDMSRAVMFASSDNGDFSFNHGVAFFKITVGYDNVESIKFVCLGGERIYGNPTYGFSNLTKASSIAGSGSSESTNNVVLAPSSGTLTKGATYYVPVILKSSSFGDLKLVYTYTNSTEITKTTSKLSSVKLVHGRVYDLGTPPLSADPNFSSAPDVTIEADDKAGTIDFTVANLEDGGVVTKEVLAGETIANLSLGAVAFNTTTGVGSVSFTCDENTDTENAKTATVRLTYTYDTDKTATKDVIITQKKAAAAGSTTYYYYFTTSLTNTSSKFTENGGQGYITFDGSTSNCGVTSFSIEGNSCTKGLKMNGSSSFEFTVSSAVTASVTFYYACRKSSDNSSARIKITPTNPAGDAVVYGSFNDFGTISSQTVALTAGTTYQIARDNKEIALVYVALTETPIP